MQPMATHIELWPIDRLIPFAGNPRTHSEAQVMQIAGSIAEFGFNNPILVDTKAGIIAGHGRLLAARKLKLTEVPVIVLDHLSSPPAAVQVPRGVVARRGVAEKTARCLDARAIDLPTLLSLLLGKVFAERPGAVKGAPFRRGAANP